MRTKVQKRPRAHSHVRVSPASFALLRQIAEQNRWKLTAAVDAAVERLAESMGIGQTNDGSEPRR